MTRFAVVGAGVVGLGLVARAAFFYRGVDPLAHSLVLLIGVGLVLGVIELVGRAQRAERLARALAALPSTPGDAEIEAAPAPLRAILRARMAGQAAGLGHAVFTPYLLGLLVTIGLLGTFMGLFETLRGAREALTSSGDVLALREGLAAPMKGLSRAFGTSAAGVSASAMLGLAAVFVRRAETRFSSTLTTLFAGPLFPLTIAGRQLAALEALVESRHALPKAAKAMERATARLEALETKLVEGQREASATSAAALRDASHETVAALVATSQEAASALREASGEAATAFREASDRSVSAFREASDRSASAFREASDRSASALRETQAESVEALRESGERSARALREEGERAAEALRAHGDAAATAFQSAADAIREDVRGGVARAADAVAPLLDRAVTRAGEVAHGEIAGWTRLLAEDAEDRRRREVAHHEALRRLASESVASLAEAERDRVEASARRFETVVERVAEKLDALGAREEATAAALEARLGETASMLGRRVDESAASLGARVSDLLREVDEASRRADARDEARLARVALVAESVEGHATALSDATARETDRARAADEAREQALATLLAGIDAKLEAHLSALGERLAGPLADAARATQAGPEAVHRLVVAETDRLEARARAEEARDGRLDALLASIDRVSEALGRRSEEQAERALALDAKLEHERDRAATLFADKLAAHADGVGESLRATADLVRDAVGLVHAGGTEMTAVAEMFTGAVDRYCGASEKWLDSLSIIEATVDKRGGHDEAADLLGAYLDQTREVFDHSLAFQRELFTELRALRAKRAD